MGTLCPRAGHQILAGIPYSSPADLKTHTLRWIRMPRMAYLTGELLTGRRAGQTGRHVGSSKAVVMVLGDGAVVMVL